MDVQKMTRDYHAKYHPADGRLTPSTVTTELMAFRRRLWVEETAEVSEAWDEWTAVRGLESVAHLMHELADVVYVAYGTAERCGVDLDDVINAVHRANMRKVPSTTGGKATKPAGWVVADEVVRELVRRADRPADPFALPMTAVSAPAEFRSGAGPVFTAAFESECGRPDCPREEIVGDDRARMVDGEAWHEECYQEVLVP